jgi:uncharacterized LabA/DUF88 family protein
VGFSFGEDRAVAGRRVAVFIDFQNCYECARKAFHKPGDSGRLGNCDPIKLAQLLAAKAGRSHELAYVGVYCGLPNQYRDAKTHAARTTQIAAWRKGGATVFTRPLQYLKGMPPREKGVDVKMAVDIVMNAVEGVYDTAIVASCDSDLSPAIEALLELKTMHGGPDVEVVAWEGRKHHLGRAPAVPFRWIRKADYVAIQDLTNYAASPAQATIGAGGSFVRRTTP